MDFSRRPELCRIADNIACWSDRYDRRPTERNDRLGRFPYLAPDFALLPRQPGLTDWMSDIHLFNIASTMSFGPSGSSINAMTTAVPKLLSGLTPARSREISNATGDRYARYDVPQAMRSGRRICKPAAQA